MTIQETNAKLEALGLSNVEVGRLYGWMIQIQRHGWEGCQPEKLNRFVLSSFGTIEDVKSILERADINSFEVDFQTAPVGPPMCTIPGRIPGFELTELEISRPAYHEGRETCLVCGRNYCQVHLLKHNCQMEHLSV